MCIYFFIKLLHIFSLFCNTHTACGRYTLDVFEYELDEPMALYGGIPIVLSHTANSTVGAFWFNPTETFVDVEIDDVASGTHWISESGIVDLMLLPGPAPKDVLRQFTQFVSSLVF